MALGSIRDIYSQDTLELEKQLKAVESAKPGAYQSNYGDVLNGLMDKIVNQKNFSYDFNADPMYHQYKDSYTQLGKQASMDAAANVSALTGGFGNSYAATAATQANQQYLNQLNNVIPELYQLAMDKYQMDTSKLYDQFNVVGTQEDREYGRHRDTVNDWYSDRDYALSRFNGSVGNDQYVRSYNQSEAQAIAKANAAKDTTKNITTLNTPSNPGYDAALNEALKASPNGDSAIYSVLAERVNSGEITEEAAYEIKEKIDKKATTKNMTKYFN